MRFATGNVIRYEKFCGAGIRDSIGSDPLTTWARSAFERENRLHECQQDDQPPSPLTHEIDLRCFNKPS